MLKVTVKNEKVVDDRWEPGTIRMSEDGKVVIMLARDYSHMEYFVKVVVLSFYNEDVSYISSGVVDKQTWLDKCPIVVENAELIIGGGSND